MSDHHQSELDAALTEQLRRFLRHVAGDSVAVDCQDGVATLRGRVATATQARALADLALGHEGVTRVESHLSIEATTPAGARLGN